VSSPIRLERTDLPLAPDDLDGVRDWLMAAVRTEVKLRGTPHPRIVLVGDGFVETLDLDRLSRVDPGADAGATFQRLRQRPGVRRALMVLVGRGDDADRDERFAILFEERTVAGEGVRRWWLAMLPYDKDPESGLGIPDAWQLSRGETSSLADLPAFLIAIAAPPTTARAATVLEPVPPVADLSVRYGELDEDTPPPSTALRLVELASGMVVPALLAGDLRGALVVRFSGRAWEVWQLPGGGPVTVEELVRYVANHREPAADAIALVQVAIRPEDEPPQPGVQVIAECGSEIAETWSPLTFPEGPDGRPQIDDVLLRGPDPVPEGGLWLGVRNAVELELISPLVGEA